MPTGLAVVLVVTQVWSCLAWLASPLLLDKRWLQAGRLEGEQHRLLQVEVPSLVQCLHLCLGRARCLSLDFQPNSGRCQLNVHSLESMAGLSLGEQQAAWQHLARQHVQQGEDVAGPCSSLVCLEQEVCVSRDCETAVCIPDATAVETTALAVTTSPSPAPTFPNVDCGSPPPAPAGMTLTSSGTRFHDTATYTCDVGTAWPDSGFLLCNESSTWQGDPGGCSYTDCYDPGLPSSYAGKLNVTPSGIACQRWDTVDPNFHAYMLTFFHKVDGSAKAANNYCRAIDDSKPWCYRSTAQGYEYCSIPQC